MDFFASQELARRNTRKLIVLLVVTLVCMIASVYLLVMFAGQFAQGGKGKAFFGDSFLNWQILGVVSGVVSAIVAGGSMMKISELRAGGAKVASLLGGRRLLPGSGDPDERRVLNVVEEMALASGIPVPPVYVLDNEPGINAFAAGHTIDDAVIGVNRGTLATLSRDELQGVIAHEYSHILNGDMRMSLRLIGILHGVQAIALIGWVILRSIGNSSSRRSSNKKEGGAIIVVLAIGAGLIAIGSVGLFFARWIKASLSRQREYLADASAVQFTRNPESIGNALKVIGAVSQHSRVAAPNAESISHMFFANMSGSMLSGLFSTHPPLVERVRRIDSRFDGNFTDWFASRTRRMGGDRDRDSGSPEAGGDARRSGREAFEAFGKAGLGVHLPGGMGGGTFLPDPAMMVASVGSPTSDDLVFSRAVVGRIPDRLLDAIRDVFHARCVVFASLLDSADASDPGLRTKQLAHIESVHGAATVQQTLALEPLILAVEIRLRLPIYEIIQGALVGLSPPQYRLFHDSVIWLTESDGRVSLFEFFLQHHLITHLDRHFGLRPARPARFDRIHQVLPELQMLLDMLIRNGQRGEAARQAALEASLGALPEDVRGSVRLSERNPGVSALNAALDRMSQAAPAVRKQFLSAAAEAITHDHSITVAEAELFRALGEALDCPVPPLLSDQTGNPDEGREARPA